MNPDFLGKDWEKKKCAPAPNLHLIIMLHFGALDYKANFSY